MSESATTRQVDCFRVANHTGRIGTHYHVPREHSPYIGRIGSTLDGLRESDQFIVVIRFSSTIADDLEFMTPERWQQIESLYHSALQVAPEKRNLFLAEACHGDDELRRQLESLLAQPTSLLDRPAWLVAPSLIDDPTRTALAAGIQLGPYKIESPLGAGGMGQVYKARDTRLNRSVAIKISSQQFSDRFEREARAISALNHPHICTLYDVGPNFLVMELVEGETLAKRLKIGPLPMQRAIEYGAQAADALAAAHAKGITHRDLKPGNIMLTKSGVKVLDFGLAKSHEDETVTATQAVMGTPAYMAPEQHEGKESDARTDIYALGLVLAEMATGKRAQPGVRPELDALPEKLAHVVERCVAPDPDDRWQSARDVKSELAWTAKQGITGAPPEHATPTSLVWPALAALALLALAALAFVHFREPAPEQRVRSTAILPPEKTSFDFATSLGPVTLSPDGRRMVFAATGQSGKSQLWLRSLDTPQAQPLPSTDRAIFPFWSPNSRWVGFFADGKLKKIDTLGGSPIALADAPDGVGGSWSANGTIVFAPETFFPLQKISADGGNASAATATDTVARSADGFPWFLPDSEHFLFVSWGGAGRFKLRLGSLSSTASTIIGEADSNAMYSDGHLLYLRENSLVAQPFDLKSMRTSGEAVPVAERVARFLNPLKMGTFSASADGLLAYQSGAEAGMRQLTWFDRSGHQVGIVGEPRPFWDLEFSPDRRTLAAVVPDASGNYDIWMYDVARGLPVRFTSDPAGAYYATWSPDGRTVIFNSTRTGHYDLYRKSANAGGVEELLYADDTDKVPTSWSPDGRLLLYFVGGGPRKTMWVLPLTPPRPGAPLKPVSFLQTRFNEVFGRISPDGRWVVYESDQSQRLEIYVAPLSRPADKHQISSNGGQYARWRQDGKEIFFEGPDGQLMAAQVQIRGETVEVSSVRGLSVRIATFHSGFTYDVSVDGQRILAAVPAGSQQAEPITLIENWTAALKK